MTDRTITLGLRENWQQFTLLVIINAFVGAMVGLERTVIPLIAATYPAVWGIGQLFTGALSDRWGRKWLIVGGMWLQAVGIGFFVVGQDIVAWLAAAMLLGLGTAVA